MFSAKTQQSYNQTIRWLRCSLSFSLLRSMIMYLGEHALLVVLAASDIFQIASEARLMQLLYLCICLLFTIILCIVL